MEASNCYLVNVSVNSYPSAKAIANGTEAIEEDRRCLYVAMTRAKDSLVIYRTQFAAQTFAPGSAVDGFNIDCGEQYFLNNLPANLYNPEYISDGLRHWDEYKGGGITLADTDDFDFS